MFHLMFEPSRTRIPVRLTVSNPPFSCCESYFHFQLSSHRACAYCKFLWQDYNGIAPVYNNRYSTVTPGHLPRETCDEPPSTYRDPSPNRDPDQHRLK